MNEKEREHLRELQERFGPPWRLRPATEEEIQVAIRAVEGGLLADVGVADGNRHSKVGYAEAHRRLCLLLGADPRGDSDNFFVDYRIDEAWRRPGGPLDP